MKARIEVVDVHEGRAVLHLAGPNRRRLALRLDCEGKGESQISRELHEFFGVQAPSLKRAPQVGATGLCGLDVELDEGCEWLEFGGKVLGNKPAPELSPEDEAAIGAAVADAVEPGGLWDQLVNLDDAAANDPDEPEYGEADTEAALERLFDAEMTALEENSPEA